MNYRGAKYLATLIAVVVSVGISAAPLQGATIEDNTNTNNIQASVDTYDLKSLPVVKPQQPKVKVHREYRAAKSKDAKDMKGFKPSLYRGKWYTPKSERMRKCIMDRESSFSYHAANPISSARGAYQFLDNNWRGGLVHMFIAESKKTKDGLVDEAKKLRGKPIHKWSRYWQDRAFFTAWRYGDGKHHWYHGSIRCY